MRRHTSQQGMTILEIMIVLAIIGLMMLIGLPAMRSFIRTDLRSDANQIAASLRAAYELAALSGIHHRVLFDLDEGSFQIQACPEEMRIHSGSEEELLDAAALEAVPRPQVSVGGASAAEVLEADSPEEAVAMAAALAGVRIGGARCVAPTTPNGDAEARGNVRTLHKERGIKLLRVHVQHLRKPAASGKVAVNFFPLGWSEKAVIELATADADQFTILVYGLSGRVEVRDDAVDADRHLRRDAAGDEAAER